MHITVCIPTRNRGTAILATLTSLASSHFRDFDVVVVDQSDDDATEEALCLRTHDAVDVAYLRSPTCGASRARNIALDLARGPIVAFTDDDCEVLPDWMDVLAANFAAHTEVVQVCGAVIAGDHDSTTGFIPVYSVSARRKITGAVRKWQEGGIGANMAFRRDALLSIGPFDEVLGAGGDLFACEDGDMTYRVLKAGYDVLELPEAVVIHRGFRTWAEGSGLLQRTGIGVGAAYMKHLRLGDLSIIPTLFVEWAKCISWGRLLLFRKRSGLRRFIGYWNGMLLSFRYGIDAQKRLYVLPTGPQGSQASRHFDSLQKSRPTSSS
jgi:glycosyltransferase involved in cell wall biosynthesis